MGPAWISNNRQNDNTKKSIPKNLAGAFREAPGGSADPSASHKYQHKIMKPWIYKNTHKKT